ALIETFSKRRRAIDETTREVLAREPEKANGNLAAIRENIAHRERPPKIRDLGLSRLQALWNSQLTVTEKDVLRDLRVKELPASTPSEQLAEQAVSWAEEHLFDRRSVVHEHEV